MLAARCTRPFVFALAITCAASSVEAQVIKGDVVDEKTTTPIFGAIVVLLDDSSHRVAATISDDSGHFALKAPGAGRYILRADRIGYRSTTSAPLDLDVGATAIQRLSAPVVPVMLAGDTIVGDNRCVVRPQEGQQTAELWEEARKVLYATELAIEERRFEATVRVYSRALDPYTLQVRRQETVQHTSYTDRPFYTNRTPEELARDGYLRHDSLAGPDADVLLSDAFADTHCFRVKNDPGDHPGLVGLYFEPIKKRKVPDVTGVLWLDQQTAELRFVDFRPTRMFADVPPRRYGGRIEFERLKNGVWIVRRWYIRLPVYGESAPGGDMRAMSGGDHVAAFHENGGEVLSTVAAQPPPAQPPQP